MGRVRSASISPGTTWLIKSLNLKIFYRVFCVYSTHAPIGTCKPEIKNIGLSTGWICENITKMANMTWIVGFRPRVFVVVPAKKDLKLVRMTSNENDPHYLESQFLSRKLGLHIKYDISFIKTTPYLTALNVQQLLASKILAKISVEAKILKFQKNSIQPWLQLDSGTYQFSKMFSTNLNSKESSFTIFNRAVW